MPPDPEPKPPAWEYKTEFAINAKLKEIAQHALEVATQDLEKMKRQLEKLQLGS